MTDKIGIGCGERGCTCSYCNNDNYDRYISDSLRQYLEEINDYLPSPIQADDEKIGGSEDLYFKVIKRYTIAILKKHKSNNN